MITFLRSILRAVAVSALIGLGSLPLVPAVLAENAKPASLDAAAKADIARIEAYLNGIKTLRTRFLQIAQNGDSASGELTIARPGRMRLEYDPPLPTLLIANGTFLIYIDRYLDQVTHVFLKNTPVGVLVAENIKLSGDLTVTRFVREPGVIRVTLAKTTEAEEGNITLVFADAPLALRQWIVIDAQGARTSVTLDALEYGVAVKPEMFEYKKPERIDRN
jgi:outer membrane lipoprotein-sorting protein